MPKTRNGLALGLMQVALLGCLPVPSGGETDTGTGTTTGTTTTSVGSTEDPPTTGGTTEGPPTTGGTTEELPTPAELKCEECGNPESVQLCYCLDNAATPPKIEQTFHGCPNDAGFVADSEHTCETMLGKSQLDPGDLHCLPEILCPLPPTEDPLADACEMCGDATVERHFCVDTFEDDVVFAHYLCLDDFGIEMFLKAECATKLSKLEAQLTSAEFFSIPDTCPGGGTTGGETTGGETTGGETTGGDTTGDPLLDCDLWDPPGGVNYVSGVYYVDTSVVTGLLADPMPLLDCDDVQFVPLPGGNYEVRYADPGELFHELGLRDSDIPLYLNGYPLEDISDTLVALGELWFIEEETEYDLLVLRSGRPYLLSYSLI